MYVISSLQRIWREHNDARLSVPNRGWKFSHVIWSALTETPKSSIRGFCSDVLSYGPLKIQESGWAGYTVSRQQKQPVDYCWGSRRVCFKSRVKILRLNLKPLPALGKNTVSCVSLPAQLIPLDIYSTFGACDRYYNGTMSRVLIVRTIPIGA